MRAIAYLLAFLVLPALAAEPEGSSSPASEAAASAKSEDSAPSTPPGSGYPLMQIAHSVTWRTIASERGRSIEVDTASIQNYAPDKVLANVRLVLDKEIVDSRSGNPYKYIMTQNRYGCEDRSAATLKRSFVDANGAVVRDDNMPEAPAMPVRSNMLEERVLRELCRPLGSQVQRRTQDTAVSNEETINRQLANIRSALGKPESANTQKPAAPRVNPPRPNTALPRKPVAKPSPPAPPVEWSYSGSGGPEYWGSIAAENRLCREGKRQSPIDIRDGLEVDLEPVHFDYQPGFFTIADTGRGIEVRTSGDMVSLLGKDYYLERLTFHYPAEERINGRLFTMGAHLEHRAADGERLNIAVLLERGAPNPTLQTLWDYLPLEGKQTVAPEAEIDLNALLPLARGYHTYMGSMTRPPCEEGVIWVVLQTPVSVSAEQEAILARLYPSLARPIQALEGRRIKSSRRAVGYSW